MDLGFGQLIEKFEEHVGKTPTKLLLYVVFVAVFALCTKAIIDNLVSPAMSILDTPLFGSTLIKLSLMMLSVGLGIGVAVQSLAAFGEWKSLKKARAVLRDAESIIDRAATDSAARHDANKAILEEIRALSDKARGLMLASANVTERLSTNSNLTDEQRETLRLILDDIRGGITDGDTATELNHKNQERLETLSKRSRRATPPVPSKEGSGG